MMKPLHLLALALAIGSGGCGGKVDLGGRRQSGGESGGAGANEPVDAAPRPIVTLDDHGLNSTLALSGDFLYLGGYDATTNHFKLSRCEKGDCAATLEQLKSFSRSIARLQAYRGGLGIAFYDDRAGYSLFTYDLPRLEQEQLAVDGLPNDLASPLFHEGFVFWELDSDRFVYRCALPACPAGPEPVALTNDRVALSADGDRVFWSDDYYVYRAGELGAIGAERLLPDEGLGAAPDAGSAKSLPPRVLRGLAAGGGMLYASIADLIPNPDCEPDCPSSIVRWPAGGGAREVVFRGETTINKIFIFGDELTWLAKSTTGADAQAAQGLFSCRIEACDATQRELGLIMPNLPSVVADETYLYWIEAEPVLASDNCTGCPTTPVYHYFDHQISRVRRLNAAP
jgi:hypothetical protein